MVEFPPLMPSATWFAKFLQGVAKELTDKEAIINANESLISPRDFGRYNIFDSNGLVVSLSVAVEGGGRQLRYLDKLATVRLSEHGHWRRNHLKTLEACLGRKPYFHYFFPSLSAIYLNQEYRTLKDFNFTLFKFFFNFIVGNIKNSDFSLFYYNETLQQRGMEIASKIKPNASSIEVVSSFGKESILGFLAIN